MRLPYLKRAALITAFSASLLLPTQGNAQSQDYRLQQTGKHHLKTSVESAGVRNNLPEKKLDSVMTYWLPLYKRTGGASKRSQLETKVIESDTVSNHYVGKHNSMITLVQSDTITRAKVSTEQRFNTYDLGSFSLWTQHHDVPDYASTTLFEGLTQYMNDPDQRNPKNTQGKTSSYHNGRIEKHLKQRYREPSSHDIEKEESKGEHDTNNAHPWSFSIYVPVNKAQDGMQFGLSREIINAGSATGTLDLLLTGTIGSNYRITSEHRFTTTEPTNGNRPEINVHYDYAVREVVTERTQRISSPVSLSLGVGFGDSQQANLTVYVGGSLIRNSDVITNRKETMVFYESFQNPQKVGFDVLSDDVNKSSSSAFSCKPSFGLSLDYDSFGLSARYEFLPDRKSRLSVGGNINF